MKSKFSKILFLLLAFCFLSQIAESSFLSTKLDKTSIESPFEESSDGESDKCFDDEVDDDKTFIQLQQESKPCSNQFNHLTPYLVNLSEQIQEIVPPPPQA